jgi:hypothetical protein
VDWPREFSAFVPVEAFLYVCGRFVGEFGRGVVHDPITCRASPCREGAVFKPDKFSHHNSEYFAIGHKRVTTTEKHYAKWVKGRQDRLNSVVTATWKK